MATDWEKSNWEKSSKAINKAGYVEMPEEISVFSWSPEPPGTPNAKVTQVHMHMGLAIGPVLLVRFKGPGTLDGFIDALIEHRTAVWGKKP